MRTVEVHVENHVEMAFEDDSAAWTFDVDLWGRCGQGQDEAGALDDLRTQLPGRPDLVWPVSATTNGPPTCGAVLDRSAARVRAAVEAMPP